MCLLSVHKYSHLWGYKSFGNLFCVELQLGTDEYEWILSRQIQPPKMANSFNRTQAIAISVLNRRQIYSDRKLYNEVHT